jgi:hypothetical protein
MATYAFLKKPFDKNRGRTENPQQQQRPNAKIAARTRRIFTVLLPPAG